MAAVHLPITAEVSVILGDVRWQSLGTFRPSETFDFMRRVPLFKSLVMRSHITQIVTIR